MGENDFIDLEQQTLTSNYPGDKYMNLHSIDYIISAKGVLLDDQRNEKINIFDVVNYNIYKNIDNSKLYLLDNSFFPKKVGQKRIIKADEGLLYTQHKVDDDGFFVSMDKSGALVYGPYAEIFTGKYDITFNYEYIGDIPSGETIGYADIYLVDFDKVIVSTPIKAGENSITFSNVMIDKDYRQAETRIFTDKEGIRFVSIRIEKTE